MMWINYFLAVISLSFASYASDKNSNKFFDTYYKSVADQEQQNMNFWQEYQKNSAQKASRYHEGINSFEKSVVSMTQNNTDAVKENDIFLRNRLIRNGNSVHVLDDTPRTGSIQGRNAVQVLEDIPRSGSIQRRNAVHVLDDAHCLSGRPIYSHNNAHVLEYEQESSRFQKEALFSDTLPLDFDQIYRLPLARAAEAVYRPDLLEGDNTEFSGLERYSEKDFQADAFQIKIENRYFLVIAIRGTHELETWLLNLTQIGLGGGGICKNLFERVSAYAERNTSKNQYQLLEKTFKNLNNYHHQQILDLMDWIEKIINNNEAFPLLVTGHSLGGFLAQSAAKRFGLSGISFNAPAIGKFFLQDDLDDTMCDKRYKDSGHVFIDRVLAEDYVRAANIGGEHLSSKLYGQGYPLYTEYKPQLKKENEITHSISLHVRLLENIQ